MDDEEEDVTFKPGDIIDSSKAKYVVIRLLGEGGFGAVYKVHDQKDPGKEYAMKVEKKIQSRKHSKLRMEIAILKLVCTERKESHFTAIIDRGKKETYFFLVMQLVGKSLAGLKNARPLRVFSMSTGLGVGIQCLEACEDLHKYGFIHRDLKPANYACGLGNKKRIIYILDFGIARKYLNAKGEMKAPRRLVKFKVCKSTTKLYEYIEQGMLPNLARPLDNCHAPFQSELFFLRKIAILLSAGKLHVNKNLQEKAAEGTIRFASIACHMNVEMGPKDDCESWFYLLLDLILERGLLWKSIYNKDNVLKLKRDMRDEKKEAAFAGLQCKAELCKIMEYLDTLQYQDHVDYSFIYKLCEMGAVTEGGSIHNPYDWELGEDPTQTLSGEEPEPLQLAILQYKKEKRREIAALRKKKEEAARVLMDLERKPRSKSPNEPVKSRSSATSKMKSKVVMKRPKGKHTSSVSAVNYTHRLKKGIPDGKSKRKRSRISHHRRRRKKKSSSSTTGSSTT